MASVSGDTSCLLHASRQGVARCPNCRQFFCGECITEHEGKLTCAGCLSQTGSDQSRPARRLAAPVVTLIQLVIAVALCWLMFYLFAETLGDMPDEFHDGTIWE